MTFTASIRRITSRVSDMLPGVKGRPATQTPPLQPAHRLATSSGGPQPLASKVSGPAAYSMAPRQQPPGLGPRVQAFSVPLPAHGFPLTAARPAQPPAPSGPLSWAAQVPPGPRTTPTHPAARPGPVGLQQVLPSAGWADSRPTAAPPRHRPTGRRDDQVRQMQDQINQLRQEVQSVHREWRAAVADHRQTRRDAAGAPHYHPIHDKVEQLKEKRSRLKQHGMGLQAELDRQQSALAAFHQPRAEKLAAGLRELAGVQELQAIGPGGLVQMKPDGSVHVDPAAARNRQHLKAHAHLLDQQERLERQQGQLHGLLQRGVLDGLPAGQLDELRQLAGMDLEQQFARLRRLADSVRHRDEELRKRTSGGFIHSVPATAAQRRELEEAERRAHQDAVDNGYL
jgi:hypothetical protein